MFATEVKDWEGSGKLTPQMWISSGFNWEEWKIVRKSQDENRIYINLIPKTQNEENWSEKIEIHHFRKTQDFNKKSHQAERIMDQICYEILETFPLDKIKFRLHELNSERGLYELILTEDYGSFPVQHQIGRLIVSENGIHMFRYFYKGGEMEKEKNEKWLKMIQNQ